MKTERAIELLNRISDSQFDGIHGDERREALEMAVRALEQNLVKESGDLVQDLVKDCISRQQAIDAVVSAMIDGADAELVEGVMELLPSAQPERTCVNCGRTANNGGWYADGRTRCPIEEHYALPKDGYCHLWEKRNVTDDDYPERRTDEPEK